MIKSFPKQERRNRRHLRVKKKVSGEANRPRLVVFRSSKHIYAQLVDDASGHTLVTASSVEKVIKEARTGKNKTEVAALVGSLIGERAREKGIGAVVFDRGGFLYHGRIRALAGKAREAGLKF